MMLLPIALDADTFDLVIILEQRNIDRLMAHDPPAADMTRLPPLFAERTLHRVVVTYASAADIATIIPMLENGDLSAAVNHLCRGWTNRPDAGDGGKYESLRILQ